MDQNPTPPSRTKFLLALPGCLLASLLPVVLFQFFVLRPIRRFLHRAAGQETSPQVKPSVAQARQRVRKATGAYNLAKRRYARAEAKLAQAQAALEAAQGQPHRAVKTEAELSTPEAWWNSSKGRFVLGSGKMLARYLLQQQRK